MSTKNGKEVAIVVADKDINHNDINSKVPVLVESGLEHPYNLVEGRSTMVLTAHLSEIVIKPSPSSRRVHPACDPGSNFEEVNEFLKDVHRRNNGKRDYIYCGLASPGLWGTGWRINFSDTCSTQLVSIGNAIASVISSSLQKPFFYSQIFQNFDQNENWQLVLAGDKYTHISNPHFDKNPGLVAVCYAGDFHEDGGLWVSPNGAGYLIEVRPGELVVGNFSEISHAKQRHRKGVRIVLVLRLAVHFGKPGVAAVCPDDLWNRAHPVLPLPKTQTELAQYIKEWTGNQSVFRISWRTAFDTRVQGMVQRGAHGACILGIGHIGASFWGVVIIIAPHKSLVHLTSLY